MKDVILIIAAMEDVELDYLISKLKNLKKIEYKHVFFYEGNMFDKNIVFCVSGIGTINMAVALTIAINKYNPKIVINEGVSGGYTKDIKKGDIIPAIREDRIDFYYYNSLLFQYNGIFKTHSKFAFVPKEYKPTYVANGTELGEVVDFYVGYENIKERAKLYTSPESIGVHSICKAGSILNNNDYIVLDIEIAFTPNKDNNEVQATIDQLETSKKQNRIDILLYSIKDRKLLFVEAKHYSNKEIRANDIPPVVNQK